MARIMLKCGIVNVIVLAIKIEIMELHKMEKYTYNGNLYSIPELAKILNMRDSVLRYRLTTGMSIEEAISTPSRSKPNKRSKTYIYNYKEYSIYQLSKESGVSIATLTARLKSGMSVKDAVEKPVRFQSNTFGTLYVYNGESYTLTSLAYKFGIKVTTLSRRLNRSHMSVDKAIDMGVAPEVSATTYVYNGEIISLKDLADKFSINIKTLRARLASGLSLDEAVVKVWGSKSHTLKYKYKGEDYSLSQLSTLSGINRYTLQARLKSGMTVEHAVELPVLKQKDEKFYYRGKPYTVRQASDEFEIHYKTLKHHMYSGETVEEAIDTVKVVKHE